MDGIFNIVFGRLIQKSMSSFTMLSLEASDLLQKLSLDSQTKTLEIPEPNKKVGYLFLVVAAFAFRTCLVEICFMMNEN